MPRPANHGQGKHAGPAAEVVAPRRLSLRTRQPHPGAAWLAVALAGVAAGCSLDTRSPPIGVSVTLTAPIAIPPEQAHAVLQDGRLANASNRLNSWCELEVRTLSGAEPRMITRGHFRVSRVSSRLLLDPTTRIPVIFPATSCSDPPVSGRGLVAVLDRAQRRHVPSLYRPLLQLRLRSVAIPGPGPAASRPVLDHPPG